MAEYITDPALLAKLNGDPGPNFNLGAYLAETDKILNLPPGYSRAQIQVESEFDPQAVSPAGARGLAQIMPATQATLEKRVGRKLDPFDPQDAALMHRMVMQENMGQFKTPGRAAMAYNGGWDPASWAKKPETAAYPGKIEAARAAGPQYVTDPALLAQLDGATPPAAAAPRKRSAAEKFDPTEGMSTYEKTMAGVGKAFVDMYEGTKQLGAGVGNKLGLVSDQTVADLQRRATERAELDKPLMNTTAGLVGNIGGNIASLAIPAGALGKVGQGYRVLSNPLTRAAIGGALAGSVAPVTDTSSRGENMALGAAGSVLGQGAASALGKLAGGAASPAVKNLVGEADRLGVPVRADQVMGSRPLSFLASAAENFPLSGGSAQRAAQGAAYTKAVSRTLGENAEALTPDVLSAAKSRIGGEFERIAANNGLQIDAPFLSSLRGVVQAGDTALEQGQRDVLERTVSRIMKEVDPATGQIPGKVYQSLRKELLDPHIGEGKGAFGNIMRNLRNVVDQQFYKSVGQNDAAALATARQQWGALRTVAPIAAKSAEGQVSPALLAGAGRAQIPGYATGGGGDLGSLARVGNLIKNTVPDSGTAQRGLMQDLLKNPLGLGAVGAGVAFPTTAAATLGTGALASRGLLAALNSNAGRRWATEGSKGLARAARLVDTLKLGAPAAARAFANPATPTVSPDEAAYITGLLGQ